MSKQPVKPVIVDYRRHMLICIGRSCVADGMTAEELEKVATKLKRSGALAPGPNCVKATRVDCLGACRSGPVVCVQPDGVWYYGVTPDAMDRIIEDHLGYGRVVEDLVFHRGPSPNAEMTVLST